MSLGVIGRQHRRNLGEKVVPFVVVDPECPTVRNIQFWRKARSYFEFLWHLQNHPPEKVLMTPTDPVYIVVVYSTYPTLSVGGRVLSKPMFRQFWDELERLSPNREGVNWLKEGF